MSLGRTFDVTVKIPLGMPASDIKVPGFKSRLYSQSHLLLMCTMEAAGDDPSTWVPAHPFERPN